MTSVRWWAAGVAIAAIVLALWQLTMQERGIQRAEAVAGETPVTVFTVESEAPGPVVLVAHGFAGSRRLMDAFSLSLARAGYTAVAFDFLGHGRHPRPLTGDLGDQDGTPAVLMGQVGEVAAWARELRGADGGLAVVGHSMATNILVRFAQETPGVHATVAVSIMAPTSGEDSPPNLLAVAGEWEPRLVAEGRRVVALGAGRSEGEVETFTTYGDPRAGTARRLVVAPRVEHVGVLYSGTTLQETVAWIDATFGRDASSGTATESLIASGRGGWIALFMGALLLLAWPGSRLLPRVDSGPRVLPGGSDWRRLLVVGAVPAVATPLLLVPVPTGFLPVVVGDYLAVHFAIYGILTAGLLWWTAGRPSTSQMLSAVIPDGGAGGRRGAAGLVVLGAALAVGWFVGAVAWPIDRFFTSFMPTPERLPLMAATLLGTLPFFLADEWLTRKAAPARGAYPLTKFLFLCSLALAVALDFSGLFFLVIIVPVILIFFVVHGLLSRWAFHRTGSPLVAGLANAVAFAWALGVTFPLYAG